jgi:hypothetical protein
MYCIVLILPEGITMTRISVLAIGGSIAAIAILFVLAMGGERYDMPEPLEVEYLSRMKDVGTAETEFSTLATGQRQLTIRHEVIEGVTPEMILWWFHTFPTRTVTVAGKSVPWYRLWHPRDHIVVVIRERGNPDIPGLSQGANLEIHERVGGKYKPFVGHIAALDATGIHLVAAVGGATIGNLRHTFTRIEGGTLYESKLVLGLDVPVMRVLVNAVIRNFVMTDEQAKGWFTHNVEEVGNFQFFLPDLYAEHHGR